MRVKTFQNGRLVSDIETNVTRLVKGATEAIPIIADYIVHGGVPEETFASRMEICRACDSRLVDGDKEYCGACDCPKWSGSELGTKLRMPRLSCPLKKFAAVIGEGKEMEGDEV